MDFNYFTHPNEQEIYIEDRGGWLGSYAVYDGYTCVQDQLNKREALKLANEIYMASKLL